MLLTREVAVAPKYALYTESVAPPAADVRRSRRGQCLCFCVARVDEGLLRRGRADVFRALVESDELAARDVPGELDLDCVRDGSGLGKVTNDLGLRAGGHEEGGDRLERECACACGFEVVEASN